MLPWATVRLAHTKMVAWCLSLLNAISKKEKTQTPHPPRSLACHQTHLPRAQAFHSRTKRGGSLCPSWLHSRRKLFLKMTSTHNSSIPKMSSGELCLCTLRLVPMWAPLINTLCHHSLPNNSALKLSQKPNISVSES